MPTPDDSPRSVRAPAEAPAHASHVEIKGTGHVVGVGSVGGAQNAVTVNVHTGSAAPAQPHPAAQTVKPESPPTRGSLRKLLVAVLPLDSELDAFCLDHFAATEGHFAAGMDAEQKRNLLLKREEPAEVLLRLREARPAACEKHAHLLRFES